LIFRFAILVEGIQSAAHDHNTLSAASAAVDRDLARHFADQLPKPLPPLTTFLSFVDLPQFPEYVEICRAVISQRTRSSFRATPPSSRSCRSRRAVDRREPEKLMLPERRFTFQAPAIVEIESLSGSPSRHTREPPRLPVAHWTRSAA
jgi:hypothetical protein